MNFKEQVVHGRIYQTIDDVRAAVRSATPLVSGSPTKAKLAAMAGANKLTAGGCALTASAITRRNASGRGKPKSAANRSATAFRNAGSGAGRPSGRLKG
jgi:hypothetical protein